MPVKYNNRFTKFDAFIVIAFILLYVVGESKIPETSRQSYGGSSTTVMDPSRIAQFTANTSVLTDTVIPKQNCQISIVVRDMDTDDERVLDSWIVSVDPEP